MNFTKAKILLIPLIGLLIMGIAVSFMVIFSNVSLQTVFKHFQISKLLTLILNWTFTVTILYFCLLYVNRYFSWQTKWRQHFTIDILVVVIITAIELFIIIQLKKQKPDWNELKHEPSFFYVFFIPLMMITIFTVVIEIVFSVEERVKLAEKLVKTEQLHTQAKYDALKSQLDHHFLFNNLSVLSSIIYEDVEKADKFIQKFSQIYRYVLDISKHNLVALQSEVEFINNYLNLYKYRFEQGIDYEVNVSENCKDLLLPPLSLQVLVENAIKHNKISRKNPLTIQVFTQNKYLIVKNNKQIRPKNVISTQTGQANIKEKYELMELELPVIESNNDFYIVKIPLIENNT